jgi:ABC-type multidrug transport system fused ATPase/permease subunit
MMGSYSILKSSSLKTYISGYLYDKNDFIILSCNVRTSQAHGNSCFLGLMMVGPSGSGKSTAWRVLLKALELHEGVEGVAHVIDPKAMTKEALYGVLVN